MKALQAAQTSHESAVAAELEVDLERLMPTRLPAGTGSAIFCLGSCFHRSEAITQLGIVVDGVRHPATAFGMPRSDLARGAGRRSRAYRSGFWATVPFAERAMPGEVQVGIEVRLGSGETLVKPMGQIEVAPSEGTPPGAGGARARDDRGELIAVCMATFEPDLGLFAVQIDSLRAQTDGGWICVISDDFSSPQRYAELQSVIGDDDRFIVSRADERLGFYRNFERALAQVPADAALVALCDQDDRWHPEKLEVLRSSLGDAQLVYSDQRLTDEAGRVLRDSFWRGRANNYRDLASELVVNTITGAAMLMRRELAELARPFPEGPGFMFHDHWIGALAIASGPVAYVDRPLYDYVQHRGAVFGDLAAPKPAVRVSMSIRLRRDLRRRAGWFARWRAAYFYGYVTREVLAQAILARCPDRLTRRHRRHLERYIASARSTGSFLWLALRPFRLVLGRSETLGSEADLVRGILWSRLVILGMAARVPNRWLGDATLPDPALFDQPRLRRWRARQ